MSTSTLSQSVAGLSAADAAFYQEHGWVIASNVIEDTLIEETLEGLRQHWSGHRDHTIPGANKHFADWMPGAGDGTRNNEYISLQNDKTSKLERTIRESRERSFVGTPLQAKREYEKLVEDVRRTIWEREQQGCSWGKLVEKFGYAYEMGIGFDTPVSKATAVDTIRGLERYTQFWWKRPASDISIADVGVAPI